MSKYDNERETWGKSTPTFGPQHEIQLFSIVVVCIMVNLQLQLLKVAFQHRGKTSAHASTLLKYVLRT